MQASVPEDTGQVEPPLRKPIIDSDVSQLALPTGYILRLTPVASYLSFLITDSATFYKRLTNT